MVEEKEKIWKLEQPEVPASGRTIQLKKESHTTVNDHVLPAWKHHEPGDQEDHRKDDKQRVTSPRPAGIVKHLGRLLEEKDLS